MELQCVQQVQRPGWQETIFNLFGLSHFSVNVLMIALIIIVQFMHVFCRNSDNGKCVLPGDSGIAMVSERLRWY